MKHRFMFFSLSNNTFDSFTSTWNLLKLRNSLLIDSFAKFICAYFHLKNVQIVIFINTLINSDIFKQGANDVDILT